MDRVALRTPAANGVNGTRIVQDSPEDNVGQLPPAEKALTAVPDKLVPPTVIGTRMLAELVLGIVIDKEPKESR
jgi:hypothetical protein